VEALAMYWKPVIRKQQLEKKDFELQEAPLKASCSFMKGGLYLQSNYDLLLYKTYRRNSSEYYFEKEPITISCRFKH
jgi:hypothetical protein